MRRAVPKPPPPLRPSLSSSLSSRLAYLSFLWQQQPQHPSPLPALFFLMARRLRTRKRTGSWNSTTSHSCRISSILPKDRMRATPRTNHQRSGGVAKMSPTLCTEPSIRASCSISLFENEATSVTFLFRMVKPIPTLYNGDVAKPFEDQVPKASHHQQKSAPARKTLCIFYLRRITSVQQVMGDR